MALSRPIPIRWSPPHADLVRWAAEVDGTTFSDFVRSAAVAKAARTATIAQALKTKAPDVAASKGPDTDPVQGERCQERI